MARCGIRWIPADSDIAELVGNGIVVRDGGCYVFPEDMCALALRTWGRPDIGEVMDAITATLARFEGTGLPRGLAYDMMVLVGRVMEECPVERSEEMTEFMIGVIHHRVFDLNRAVSMEHLGRVIDRLGSLRRMFGRTVAGIAGSEAWKSEGNVKTRAEFAASLEIDDDSADRILRDVVLMSVDGEHLGGPHGDDGWTAWRDALVTRIHDAVHGIGTIDDGVRRDPVHAILSRTGALEGRRRPRTAGSSKIMILDRLAPGSDERLTGTLWAMLLYAEAETVIRRFNIGTSDGYRMSDRLRSDIARADADTAEYPIRIIRPIAEDHRYSASGMYAELLDPELGRLRVSTQDSYKDLMGMSLDDGDRSVIYSVKTVCRQKWETASGWDEVFTLWRTAFDACGESYGLLRMNLVLDMLHYFRLYCERDAESMKDHLETVEDVHRTAGEGRWPNIAAESLLELSMAEAVLGHTSKAGRHYTEAEGLAESGSVDTDSIQLAVSFTLARAYLDIGAGDMRSAMRRIEGTRETCLRNGMVSTYIVAASRLLKAYRRNSDRPVCQKNLEEDLRGRRDSLTDCFALVRGIVDSALRHRDTESR